MAGEALPVLIFMLSVIVLTFGAMLQMVEPENVPSMHDAVYFILITISTVGYGDMTPETQPGKFIICVLIFGGSLYMAIPLGIVGGSFNRVWEERDRRLLLNRTQNRLFQWGYTPDDIPQLFCVFDHNKDGQLDISEFCEMIGEMRLGLSRDRMVHLFKIFDEDGSGGVDYEEFIGLLFPEGHDESGPSVKEDNTAESQQEPSPTRRRTEGVDCLCFL